jgi:hypothetical protein
MLTQAAAAPTQRAKVVCDDCHLEHEETLPRTMAVIYVGLLLIKRHNDLRAECPSHGDRCRVLLE